MASAFSAPWMALTIVKRSRTPKSREARLARRVRVTVRDPEEMSRRAYLKCPGRGTRLAMTLRHRPGEEHGRRGPKAARSAALGAPWVTGAGDRRG